MTVRNESMLWGLAGNNFKLEKSKKNKKVKHPNPRPEQNAKQLPSVPVSLNNIQQQLKHHTTLPLAFY